MSEAVTGTFRERLEIAARGFIAVALLTFVFLFLDRQGFLVEIGKPVFGLGLLLIAGTVAGSWAALVRLPRLTGYILAGLAAGPHGFHLLDHEAVKALSLINGLALAIIALEAGVELTLSMLKRSIKSLLWQSLTQTLILATGMAALFAVISKLGLLEFSSGLDTVPLLALAAVWGAIAVSKSPAATLAILKETRATGPVAEIGLGVVVLFDVLVLVLFAITVLFAKVAFEPGAEFSIAELEELGIELFASVAAGTTFGLVIALYFRVINRERLLFLLIVCYGITAFCAYFHYDTLLVFAVAGFIVMNLTKQGPRLVEITEQVGPPVMIVFFATAGAHLDLEVLASTWPVALSLAGGRIVLTWIASQVGHRLAGDEPVVRRYMFSSLISQAGVTIGLATIAQEKLGEIGAGLGTLAIAVVGINEMVGPIVFKIALQRAGAIQDQGTGASAAHVEVPHG